MMIRQVLQAIRQGLQGVIEPSEGKVTIKAEVGL